MHNATRIMRSMPRGMYANAILKKLENNNYIQLLFCIQLYLIHSLSPFLRLKFMIDSINGFAFKYFRKNFR